MKTYCVKCRRDIENIDPEMARTKKKKRLIMQSKRRAADSESQDL